MLMAEPRSAADRIELTGAITIREIEAVRRDLLAQLESNGLDAKTPLEIDISGVTEADIAAFGEAVKVEDMNGDGDPNNEYALSLTDNMAWNDIFTGSFGVMPGTWHMRDGRLE